MLAVRIDHFGPPAELFIQELPKPYLAVDEVLVEFHAAGISPSNVKNVLGMMQHTTLPRISGRDFAGIVVEGSESLIGTEVWDTGGDISFPREGTHAQYVTLPKDGVTPKPGSLSEAVILPSLGLSHISHQHYR